MTSKFDDFEQDRFDDPSLDNNEMPIERFELLSAYIDDELSPTERQQVQQWLDNDPKVKRLYTQLLGLQTHIQSSEAIASEQSIAEITAGVFESIDRRRYQRRLVWSGSAIAASIIAAVTGFIPGLAPLEFKLAQEQLPDQLDSPTVMLAVAVNKPAINIPDAMLDYDLELQNSVGE